MAALYAVADVLEYQRLNQQSTVLQFCFGAAIFLFSRGIYQSRKKQFARIWFWMIFLLR